MYHSEKFDFPRLDADRPHTIGAGSAHTENGPVRQDVFENERRDAAEAIRKKMRETGM